MATVIAYDVQVIEQQVRMAERFPTDTYVSYILRAVVEVKLSPQDAPILDLGGKFEFNQETERDVPEVECDINTILDYGHYLLLDVRATCPYLSPRMLSVEFNKWLVHLRQACTTAD